MRRRVEPEVADLERRRPLDRRAAGERPAAARAARRTRTACRGSRRRRRRGPSTRSSTASRAVSISTGVQTPRARSSRQDIEAVDAGQHHVEHDRVVRRGPRHPERVLARRPRRRPRAPPRAARARAGAASFGSSSTTSTRIASLSCAPDRSQAALICVSSAAASLGIDATRSSSDARRRALAALLRGGVDGNERLTGHDRAPSCSSCSRPRARRSRSSGR